MNQQIVTPQIGGQVNVLLFIVIIIGGLGSTLGCLVGALLVGLITNYVGFLAPKLDDVLEHRPDGGGAAVAAAGPLPGRQSLTARADARPPPLARPAAQPLAGGRCWSLIVVALALTPFVFPGTKALNVAAKVIVFIVLAASFDLLLGYTGIVSFAHTMFFGIGAYGIAIAATRLGPTWPALALGTVCALVVSLVLSLVIGLFSLRVRAIFFAMITLAVASAFATLASQLSDFTGGEDGLTFKVPEALQPGTSYADEPVLGASIDGRLVTYYLLFVAALVLVLLLLRIVNSPFGRVLQAIRENDFRAEAIGYRTVVYRTLASVISAAVRDPRRRAARALAALQRARHDAVVRDHARRAADRRHRRHGHDLRRGRRQRAAGAGAELPAGPDEARRRRRCRACRCWRRSSRPTAGCSGSASCSCSRSTTSRAASSAGCARYAGAAQALTCGDAHPTRGIPPTRVVASAIVGALSLLLTGCALAAAAAERARRPGRPPAGRCRAPESQGVSSAALADLVDFGAANDMDSLLVVRHGPIVADAYYAPFRAGQGHRSTRSPRRSSARSPASPSKSGDVRRLDEPVLDSFVFRTIDRLDADKQAMTIEQLLDSNSGLDWQSRSPTRRRPRCCRWSSSRDWVGFVLDRPMAQRPGTVFNYDSGAWHLMSAILAKKTGMDTLAYAKQTLFAPLGIADARWRADPQGVRIGGYGLFLQPRDMAKIGYLYLHHGEWAGGSCCPRRGPTRSLTPRSTCTSARRWRFATRTAGGRFPTSTSSWRSASCAS